MTGRVWTFEQLRAKYMHWYFTKGQRKGPMTPHQLFAWSRKVTFVGLKFFADRNGWFGRGDLCVLSWDDVETGT